MVRVRPFFDAFPPLSEERSHDRKHHPSYDRRSVPDRRGRRDRGRRRLILTGCGDQTDKASSTPSGAANNSSAPLFSKLPKKIQDAGVIKVGTDATYAPMEFTEGGKIVGVDPDIAAA